MKKQTRLGAPEEVRERLQKVQGCTVAAERCKECLFSSDRLTDKKEAAKIIKSCLKNDTYFSCHRFSFGATEPGTYTSESVCCRAFFDTQNTQPLSMAKAMGIVEFVDDDGNVVKIPNPPFALISGDIGNIIHAYTHGGMASGNIKTWCGRKMTRTDYRERHSFENWKWRTQGEMIKRISCRKCFDFWSNSDV
jgi:hypothetical protein